MSRRRQTRFVTPCAAVACAQALLLGCAADEQTPCDLAWLQDPGACLTEDPLATPLDVGEVRRVTCMRGVVPCADETVDLRGSSTDAVGVYRDSAVLWVFHVVGLAPGRSTLRLTCGPEERHSFDVEVR